MPSRPSSSWVSLKFFDLELSDDAMVAWFFGVHIFHTAAALRIENATVLRQGQLHRVLQEAGQRAVRVRDNSRFQNYFPKRAVFTGGPLASGLLSANAREKAIAQSSKVRRSGRSFHSIYFLTDDAQSHNNAIGTRIYQAKVKPRSVHCLRV